MLLWLATFAAYGWYNLGFIQHQGRYLFPALPAWSLLFAIGWWAALERRASFKVGVILLAGAVAHLVIGPLGGRAADRWTLLLFGLAGLGMLLHGLLSGRISRMIAASGAERQNHDSHDPSVVLRNDSDLRPILYVCLFLVMIALDIAIPFLYIVPQLSL